MILNTKELPQQHKPEVWLRPSTEKRLILVKSLETAKSFGAFMQPYSYIISRNRKSVSTDTVLLPGSKYNVNVTHNAHTCQKNVPTSAEYVVM